MSQRMLIDARHPEETRVAVVNGQRIEEFDFEAADRKQLKGNIYLAKVTRVEPSLQAAFVEYGGNRHGFLAFSEIHPDYYQIPKEDRDALLKEEQELHAEEAQEDEEHEGEDEVVATGGHDDTDSLRRQRQALRRRYKIQEVIRRRQVLLIQVVKEERGNKGAALTTYLSLAGRYCVLMPNTAHGGGISRKISNMADRRRLKSIMADLKLPQGMGAIVRTAGLKRGKADIKRDFEYLTRLWDEIRETTLASTAPCLVHEDSGLIKRAVRDLYNKDIDQILVDGPEGFEAAHRFMSMLMPTHAPKVMQYDDAVPLFQRFGVEAQLAAMYQPVVQLKSGGYLVINPTEALVSIDINSGRSTREHGIEETAFKTNMEAAEEIGRQLRLRDMAGLVVIDFIDMEVNGNNRRVERAMKDALRHDRARIQLGRISSFGLMEMSRQRLRTGILEASTHVCPMCDGSGYVRAVASAALAALRDLEAEAIKGRASEFTLRAGPDVAVYILNRKRAELAELEERYGVGIEAVPDESLMGPNYVIDVGGPAPTRQIVLAPIPAPVTIVDDEEEYVAADTGDDEDDEEEGDAPREARASRPEGERGDRERGDRERGGRGRRRRRGGRDRAPGDEAPTDAETIEGDASSDGEAVADDTITVIAEPVAESDTEATKKRRRGRRGGRRREGVAERGDEVSAEGETVEAAPEPELELVAEPAPEPVVEPAPAKRPRRGRKAAAVVEDVVAEDTPPPAPPAADPVEVVEEAPVAVKAPRKRAPRRKAGESAAEAAEPVAAIDEAPPAPPPAPVAKAPAPEAPANDAAAETPANDAAPAPEGEPRKGWWSRTFGA